MICFSVCVATSCRLMGIVSFDLYTSLAKQLLLGMRKERLSGGVLAEPRVKLKFVLLWIPRSVLGLLHSTASDFGIFVHFVRNGLDFLKIFNP